ncbi:MAG TPA: alpha/beta fold hydrolase [Saprospiraceae bacterium]|nr:alpha/beta fold hydrolase [Saprospiraceae bacterium]
MIFYKYSRRLFYQIAIWIFISCILLVVLLSIPWGAHRLRMYPNPSVDYADAFQRIEILKSLETNDLNPLCQLQFYTHGERVARVAILVHGYTSCPQQFADLGKRFYDAGYNVLIAPLPHHGLKDRMTEQHRQLSAQEMAAYADQVLDIAQGLGENVLMAGLSAGAVVTAFAARHRAGLGVGIVISPAFGYKGVPTWAAPIAMNLYALMPNSYGWWDAARQEQGGALHGYPRHSSRALAALLRLGFAARMGKLKAQQLIVVTNSNDAAVNNQLIYSTIHRWEQQGVQLRTYEFSSAWQLDHDLIEPTHPKARTDLVYPVLLKLAQ